MHIQKIACCAFAVALMGAGCAAQTATPITPEPIAVPSVVIPTSTQTTESAPIQKPTIKTTAPKPASMIMVHILREAFSPQVIAANVGDTIVWTNQDTVSHTSHSDGALIWDTGSILPGKSAGHRFMSPGTYLYSDGNTGMKGTVIIHAAK